MWKIDLNHPQRCFMPPQILRHCFPAAHQDFSKVLAGERQTEVGYTNPVPGGSVWKKSAFWAGGSRAARTLARVVPVGFLAR